MKYYIQRFMAATLLISTFSTMVFAQAANRPAIPTKVQVVISRYEGDKKVSSLPYTLAATANEARSSCGVRMGSQIPVPTAGGGGAYTFQNVGTNIDCSVTSVDDTRFRVEVSINDTSVMERRSTDLAPTLRTFSTNNSVILRDGQTSQFTSAADKNTGEVVKVDVTLTVEKEGFSK